MRKFRIRVANLLRRVGNFFRHPIQTTTTISNAVIQWVKDPDLTVLGAGILGSLVGRLFLYGSLAVSSAVLGLWYETATIALIVVIDVGIHLQTLQSFRRLMAFDAMTHMLRLVPDLQPV